MAELVIQPPVPTPSARSGGRAATIAIVTILLLAFPLVITGALVPHFEELFKDFGVALPASTRWIIRLGHAASSVAGWAVIVVALAGIIVPLSFAASRRPALASALLLLSILLTLGYIVVLVISMFLPLVTMIESLQQGGAV